MKSKELKSYNLPEERTIIAQIDAKPTGFLFFLFAIGIILLSFKQFIWGLCLLLSSLLMTLVFPKRTLIEFSNDFLVLYNHANKSDCEILYYEDVTKWNYHSGLSYDTLSITLIDDSIHKIDGFSKIKFESLMNRFLKDKKEKIKKTKNKGASHTESYDKN